MIPAGSTHYEVKASTKPGASMMARPLDRDILLTSVMPHMHWLGKDFTFAAVLPDGKTRIPLIKIDHWNFNWQGTYAFKEPIRVPKGSWFEVEAHFDNSESNPANQNKPPKVVRWGEGTNDEMCIGIFEWVVVEGEPEPCAEGAAGAESLAAMIGSQPCPMIGQVNDISDFGNGVAHRGLDAVLQGHVGQSTTLAASPHLDIDDVVLDVEDRYAAAVPRDHGVNLLVEHLLNAQTKLGRARHCALAVDRRRPDRPRRDAPDRGPNLPRQCGPA